MNKPVKVIDLFAGPGGLGEGFSACRANGKQAFKIAISIEKEESAHRTLLLRAFFRQFEHKDVPEEYYAFLRGELGKHPEDELYKIPKLAKPLEEARKEAQQLTLGEDNNIIYKKIREAIGGDECILIGGPPCQAYSLVGRSRNYGAKDRQYSATDDHRNFLYLEYLKILARFQPKVFIMENVKGMLSAKVDGKLIFSAIQKDLQNPHKATNVEPDPGRDRHSYRLLPLVSKNGGYVDFKTNGDPHDPHDFLIYAEHHGLPQARHRVVILGVRDDIATHLVGGTFKGLIRSTEQVSVEQVIGDLPRLRSRLSKGQDSVANWRKTITDLGNATLSELTDDPLLPDRVRNNFSRDLDRLAKSPSAIGADRGLTRSGTVPSPGAGTTLESWYHDPRLNRHVVNHQSRGHIAGDLLRYLYYSSHAQILKKSPKAESLPKALWPAHKNFESGKFSDRFRVQLANMPGTTVTSHISKDGHYYIHYDPQQCRSLTVREAARLQTFPDNYYFVGSRTQQYVQVGNAVPPYLSVQIAKIVASLLEST